MKISQPYFKRIQVLNTLLSLIFLIIISVSCKKEKEECDEVNCNKGTQNTEICSCTCSMGYLGNNCELFDSNKIQVLLENGETPISLFNGGIPLDSLYGKYYVDGLIFYLDTINGNGMVSALSSYIPYNPALWGCPQTDIAGINNSADCHGSPTCFQPIPVETEISTRIGDGLENTNLIIAQCTDSSNAASLCRSLGENWFLPSRGELNLMYVNLHLTGLGDFEDHVFLSSSEGINTYSIWTQTFTNGQVIGSDKYLTADFRAARAF